MKFLRSITEKYGALLILDEVITGFRLGMGGTAEYYDIQPDLLTFGKIIGGGMPVGAFGGGTEIMDKLAPLGPVYQAGTLSGNPVAMTAGLETLKKLADGKIHKHLEKNTNLLVDSIVTNAGSTEFKIVSIASIFWIVFQPEAPCAAHEINKDGIEYYNRIYNDILNNGVYLPPSGYEVAFLSSAHTEEIITQAANIIASAISSK
jgi:glutamate-1-semialdehyde 2,1-aminomutase